MKPIPHLARRETILGFGDAEFRARRERDSDRATLADVKSRIAVLFNASRFEPSQIAALASRQLYATAVAVLMREAKIDEIAFAGLLKPVAARIAPFRAARSFDVVKHDAEALPVTVDSLRVMLPSEKAACALAALGLIDWSTEKRPRPRLVFILRELIEARS